MYIDWKEIELLLLKATQLSQKCPISLEGGTLSDLNSDMEYKGLVPPQIPMVQLGRRGYPDAQQSQKTVNSQGCVFQFFSGTEMKEVKQLSQEANYVGILP